MRPAAGILAGFDPGPEIRRSVRGHERHVPRLRAAARELGRFARMRDAPEQGRALGPRLAALRGALWRSPYYLATLRRRGVSPGDLRRLDDLRHFPLLDRETLGGSFAEMPALPAKRAGRLLVDRTSGSTGRPVTVLKEDYDTVHMWAVLRFWTRRLGLSLPRRPRVALLCSLPHGVEYRTPLPALGGGTLVRISLARADPGGRLRAFSPHVVFSDPAGLRWLCGQGEPPRPRLLLSSAMHLSPHLRRRVEGTLRAPVLNYYSCSETGPLAWECRSAPGRFHVLLPDVWLESVGGELVVTRLRASVLPLLRYRTGDRGRVVADPCRCGYRGVSVVGLGGRRACTFLTPAGQEVDAWQLDWAFRHQPLDGFRLTQVSPCAFRLETTGERGDRLVGQLRATLCALGWDRPRVVVRRVAAGRLARGKPEPFARDPRVRAPTKGRG